MVLYLTFSSNTKVTFIIIGRKRKKEKPFFLQEKRTILDNAFHPVLVEFIGSRNYFYFFGLLGMVSLT